MRERPLKGGDAGGRHGRDGVGSDVEAGDIPADGGHPAQERSIAAAEIEESALAAKGDAKAEQTRRV